MRFGLRRLNANNFVRFELSNASAGLHAEPKYAVRVFEDSASVGDLATRILAPDDHPIDGLILSNRRLKQNERHQECMPPGWKHVEYLLPHSLMITASVDCAEMSAIMKR